MNSDILNKKCTKAQGGTRKVKDKAQNSRKEQHVKDLSLKSSKITKSTQGWAVEVKEYFREGTLSILYEAGLQLATATDHKIQSVWPYILIHLMLVKHPFPSTNTNI